MDKSDEPWVQRESGVWISWRAEKAQSRSVESADDLVVERDWAAYWQAQGQSWRGEPEIEIDRQHFLAQRLSGGEGAFKDVTLTRADVEWLIGKHEEQRKKGMEWQELDLQGALCEWVDFSVLPLKGANFGRAQLGGVNFGHVQLKEAYFIDAQLEGADFGDVQLKGAYFVSSQLEGANFRKAQLEGAHFAGAQLKRADFRGAQLKGANFGDAQLEGADFRRARIADANFAGATLIDDQGVGPRCADALGWGDVYLANSAWGTITQLGDEVQAREKELHFGESRLTMYQRAMRAYRQLATALEDQGPKEEAERFAY